MRRSLILYWRGIERGGIIIIGEGMTEDIEGPFRPGRLQLV
jgi:hypothetical protein